MSEWRDIGHELHHTRTRKGLELADISHQLRITVPILRALESNDYSVFSSPAYAKSFLQQYSDHLGIDASEWLSTFNTNAVLADVDHYEYLKDHPEDQPSGKTKSIGFSMQRTPRNLNVLPASIFLLTVGLISAVFFLFVYLDKKFNSEPGQTTEPVPPATGTSQEATPTDQTQPEGTPTPVVPDEETPSAIIIQEDPAIPRAIIVTEDEEE